MEKEKDNLKNSSSGKKFSLREVDILTQDVHSWWGNTFVFIKKNRVRTWTGVAIVAFIAGALAAFILTVSNNIQNLSRAAEQATMSLTTVNTTIAKDDTFNLTINLDTQSNNVVVAKAVINYNKDDFQLTEVDTLTGDFEVEKCNGTPTTLCAIVNDDSANGELTITVSNPSPGINSPSATVATLTFTALRAVTPNSPNFTLSYAEGSYDDSDAILDDGEGTDILNSVNNISITVVPEICTAWTYSDWTPSVCPASGTQERAILTYVPEGCGGGNSEPLERECTYTPPACTSESYTYSDWTTCQVNDTRSRTVISRIPADCMGGVEPVLTETCDYPHPVDPPTCTSFDYSDWSVCQVNNTQSRTATGVPAGCTGGDPVLTQECSYVIINPPGNSDNEHRSKPKEVKKPKRYTSNSPEKLDKGDIITERGKNFSKNKKVSLYFSKYGGGYYPPRIVKTNSKGDFSITYKIPLNRPTGTYSWYAIDLATGKKSKTEYYRVN